MLKDISGYRFKPRFKSNEIVQVFDSVEKKNEKGCRIEICLPTDESIFQMAGRLDFTAELWELFYWHFNFYE
jgi:hypothetical protein